jgi:hypothetical protein
MLKIEFDEHSKRALSAVIDAALRAGGLQALPHVNHLLALVTRAEAAASNVVPMKSEEVANG